MSYCTHYNYDMHKKSADFEIIENSVPPLCSNHMVSCAGRSEVQHITYSTQ